MEWTSGGKAAEKLEWIFGDCVTGTLHDNQYQLVQIGKQRCASMQLSIRLHSQIR